MENAVQKFFGLPFGGIMFATETREEEAQALAYDSPVAAASQYVIKATMDPNTLEINLEIVDDLRNPTFAEEFDLYVRDNHKVPQDPETWKLFGVQAARYEYNAMGFYAINAFRFDDGSFYEVGKGVVDAETVNGRK